MAESEEQPSASEATPQRAASNLLKIYLPFLVLYLIWYIAPKIHGVYRLDAIVTPHQRPLMIASATIAAIGYLMFMGGALIMLFRGERSTPEQNKRFRDHHPINQNPGLFTYRRNWSGNAGARFSFEFSAKDFKEAWRTGAWRTDPRTRGIWTIVIGAVTMGLGAFAAAWVISPAPVKVSMAALLAYAAIRLVFSFRTA